MDLLFLRFYHSSARQRHTSRYVAAQHQHLVRNGGCGIVVSPAAAAGAARNESSSNSPPPISCPRGLTTVGATSALINDDAAPMILQGKHLDDDDDAIQICQKPLLQAQESGIFDEDEDFVRAERSNQSSSADRSGGIKQRLLSRLPGGHKNAPTFSSTQPGEETTTSENHQHQRKLIGETFRFLRQETKSSSGGEALSTEVDVWL